MKRLVLLFIAHADEWAWPLHPRINRLIVRLRWFLFPNLHGSEMRRIIGEPWPR